MDEIKDEVKNLEIKLLWVVYSEAVKISVAARNVCNDIQASRMRKGPNDDEFDEYIEAHKAYGTSCRDASKAWKAYDAACVANGADSTCDTHNYSLYADYEY